MADEKESVLKQRLFMLHDAWMRIMDPEQEAVPRDLYTLGYYWALTQVAIGKGLIGNKMFEEIMDGPYLMFDKALTQYIDGLPKSHS